MSEQKNETEKKEKVVKPKVDPENEEICIEPADREEALKEAAPSPNDDVTISLSTSEESDESTPGDPSTTSLETNETKKNWQNYNLSELFDRNKPIDGRKFTSFPGSSTIKLEIIENGKTVRTYFRETDEFGEINYFVLNTSTYTKTLIQDSNNLFSTPEIEGAPIITDKSLDLFDTSDPLEISKDLGNNTCYKFDNRTVVDYGGGRLLVQYNSGQTYLQFPDGKIYKRENEKLIRLLQCNNESETESVDEDFDKLFKTEGMVMLEVVDQNKETHQKEGETISIFNNNGAKFKFTNKSEEDQKTITIFNNGIECAEYNGKTYYKQNDQIYYVNNNVEVIAVKNIKDTFLIDDQKEPNVLNYDVNLLFKYTDEEKNNAKENKGVITFDSPLIIKDKEYTRKISIYPNSDVTVVKIGELKYFKLGDKTYKVTGLGGGVENLEKMMYSEDVYKDVNIDKDPVLTEFVTKDFSTEGISPTNGKYGEMIYSKKSPIGSTTITEYTDGNMRADVTIDGKNYIFYKRKLDNNIYCMKANGKLAKATSLSDIFAEDKIAKGKPRLIKFNINTIFDNLNENYDTKFIAHNRVAFIKNLSNGTKEYISYDDGNIKRVRYFDTSGKLIQTYYQKDDHTYYLNPKDELLYEIKGPDSKKESDLP